ncbi:hypothetical protein MC885_006707 [Smutsia gigantea]|nr:hypothetical protein MC885_006707 [Smutsia gigantea]
MARRTFSALPSVIYFGWRANDIGHHPQGEPRPRPGDLTEIFRIGYEHWAIYVEDDCVVHLAPPSEQLEAGSIISAFSSQAIVRYSHLEDVLRSCSWKINNELDGTYLPLPVDKIMQCTKKMVEQALMEGAKAMGAVISAMGDSMRPKPIPG